MLIRKYWVIRMHWRYRDYLLKSLAVVFGFIKLNSIIIFGEFKGKTQLDTLKIRFLDEKIFKECQRDLRICRKLLALNIEF